MSDFAISLYNVVRTDDECIAKLDEKKPILLWIVPTKFAASNRFLERGTNTDSIEAQMKVMASKGFTAHGDTMDFSFPKPINQDIRVKLTMKKDDADVHLRKIFIGKGLRLYDPKLEAKLIFSLPRVIEYYIDGSLEDAYNRCPSTDHKIIFLLQMFESLLDELEITKDMKIQRGGNAGDPVEPVIKEAEAQIRSLIAVIQSDQCSSLLSHPNMGFCSSVTRVLDNLLATIQADCYGLIWEGRPENWVQFYDMKPEQAEDDVETTLTDNASKTHPNVIVEFDETTLLRQEKEEEELFADEDFMQALAETTKQAMKTQLTIMEFTAQRMEEKVKELGLDTITIADVKARYRQACCAQYGQRQDDTKKHDSLGARTYNLVASSVSKDKEKLISTTDGFPRDIIQRALPWEGQVRSVIQYLARTLSLFSVFTDIKMMGLGVNGGPVSLMRISRIGVQKAAVDALLLLALCMPDLCYTTQEGASKTQSVSDWITESQTHKLASSLGLSASSGTLIREAICVLAPLSKNETSFADTIHRILRESGTPTEGQNIIKSAGIEPDETPKLTKTECFKLYINKDDLEDISQLYNDYEGLHNTKAFKAAILGKSLRITYYIPKLVKSGKELKHFGRPAYALDYNEVEPKSIKVVGDAEIGVMNRYGCIISCLADEIVATGTIAQGIETVLRNQQTIFSALDNAEEYIARDVNPLEFLCKSIALRRLNTIVKARKATNEKFLSGAAKTKALSKFKLTDIKPETNE